MATPKTPDGTPVTDSAGNEIKVDVLVNGRSRERRDVRAGLRPRRRRRDGWRLQCADRLAPAARRGWIAEAGESRNRSPDPLGCDHPKDTQLFKKFNYRVVWADKSKGPSKLAVESYAFGESVRLNSWVILKAKPQGGGS